MIMGRALGLLLLGVLWSVDCRRMKTALVQFNSVSSTFNPETVGFYDFFITPNSNGRSVEMNARLLVNVTEELHVALNVLMRNQAKDIYKHILSYDFDICRLDEDFMRQTIARLWFKNIRKYSNLPMSCPAFAGVYYVKSMRLNTASVPMFVTSGEYMTNVALYVKTGAGGQLITNTSLEMQITKN